MCVSTWRARLGRVSGPGAVRLGDRGEEQRGLLPPAALGCGVGGPVSARDTAPHRHLVAAEPGSSVQFSSVAQSCPSLFDPMNRSTPGLPVHHQLPEPGRESCKMQPLNRLLSSQGGPEPHLPPTLAGAGRRGLGSRRKLNGRRQEKGPPSSGSSPEPTHFQDSRSQPRGSRPPHLDHHGPETRLKGCLHIY